MVERFLQQTAFRSQEDYRKNLHIRVPENFNFAYDVVDAYAEEQPDRKALLWTNDQGAEIQFTFADMKRETDRTASYFQRLGIGKGDVVMLILKRRYEFWFSILALHKLGAVVIPATHLLTKKDVVYRCNTAGIKAIVAAGERVITDHVAAAMPESPTTELLISVGPEIPEGFLDFHAGIANAAPFVRPQRVNANDDIMMMYFTSGTTGEPKMVAHDFTYPLGHISTGCFWHNLHDGSLHLTIADTGWAKAAWGKLYGQWLAGANIFVYDHEKFTPADILHKIEQYRITSLCAPPTIYRFLIREDLSKYDLSSLEYCTTAGEALNGAVYDTFKQLTGVRLMEGFGQTETTLTLATFPWMEPKPGSMGVPTPPVRNRPADARRTFGRGRRTGADRNPHRQGKTAGAVQGVLPERRTHARSLARRSLLHGRRGMARRGRLFLVRGTCRRRDQEFGLPHRPLRGGERADDPPRRGGVRHYGRARRNPRTGGQSDDHPRRKVQDAGRGSADQRAAEPREADHGALQVSAHHRIRGGVAQDDQRQNPTQGDSQRG